MANELETEHRLTKVEEACGAIPKMAEQIETITLQLSKYEGRWGTVTMIGMGLWGMFAVFKDDIFKFLRITHGN